MSVNTKQGISLCMIKVSRGLFRCYVRSVFLTELKFNRVPSLKEQQEERLAKELERSLVWFARETDNGRTKNTQNCFSFSSLQKNP